MTLNQISVFLENKPGKLQELTAILAKNNINMRALSLAEASDFGIVRIIVDDLAAASDLLKNEGLIYTITRVLGVAIPDEPGGLNRVLHVLSGAAVNVEYMYACVGQNTGKAIMVMQVSDLERAEEFLKSQKL